MLKIIKPYKNKASKTDKEFKNYKILRLNKKAEKVLSVWWFFVLMIIGAGIVMGVLVFNSKDYNVNWIEADILAERIVDCVSDNNYLTPEFLDKARAGDFEIYKECWLDEEVFGKGGSFFFKVGVYEDNLENKEEDLLDEHLLWDEIKGGDYSFEKDCEIQTGSIETPHFAKCVEKNEFVFYNDAGSVKKARLVVLGVSNQKGKKISMV